ncbi:uncharacterized protein K452DRAFT_23871 [Aplosporella prunicola CBS 121167]|uniref:Uncharacterized protein n=1 Tax=Aplosporella prunicola CBS 121167 TaxID=1176127 RepID=A0A6A6BEI7_9PEZI|nr:uncharacterized protein K452DRAFT_23871 [Aplosporella prunicola CBS 121167]KAF2141948.1 hypothetical protein K452DRAFT_23871 [Aplosporella prunicola CBS 121167]
MHIHAHPVFFFSLFFANSSYSLFVEPQALPLASCIYICIYIYMCVCACHSHRSRIASSFSSCVLRLGSCVSVVVVKPASQSVRQASQPAQKQAQRVVGPAHLFPSLPSQSQRISIPIHRQSESRALGAYVRL